jgi:uncharacterized ferritin-like protein (DUF455 family)
MDLICREEVRHVERGVFWSVLDSNQYLPHNMCATLINFLSRYFRFEALCKKENLDPVSTFHGIAKRLTQSLLPPFNIDARRAAGLREAYYVPIQTGAVCLTAATQVGLLLCVQFVEFGDQRQYQASGSPR